MHKLGGFRGLPFQHQPKVTTGAAAKPFFNLCKDGPVPLVSDHFLAVVLIFPICFSPFCYVCTVSLELSRYLFDICLSLRFDVM